MPKSELPVEWMIAVPSESVSKERGNGDILIGKRTSLVILSGIIGSIVVIIIIIDIDIDIIIDIAVVVLVLLIWSSPEVVEV